MRKVFSETCGENAKGGAESAPSSQYGRVNQFDETYHKCRINIYSKMTL